MYLKRSISEKREFGHLFKHGFNYSIVQAGLEFKM